MVGCRKDKLHRPTTASITGTSDMAFAPYYNTPDMHLPAIIGTFYEKEVENRFEFSGRGGPHDHSPSFATDFPHMVFVGPYGKEEIRYARVLKTVAYVVTVEEDDGSPLVQKWDIKKHTTYRDGA